MLGELNGLPVLLAALFNCSNEMHTTGLLLDATDRAVCVIDQTNHEILYANELLSGMAKMAREDCIGRPCYEVLCGMDGFQGEQCFCFQAFHSGKKQKQYNPETRQWISVLGRAVPMGEHHAVAFFIQNETEQERAREAIQEKNQKLQQLQAEAILNYQRQLNTVLELNSDAVSTFQMNLTKNTCGNGASNYPNLLCLQEKGTAEGYFEAAAADSPEQEYAAICKHFDREALLEGFAAGRTRVEAECHYLLLDGEEHLLRTILSMVQNPLTHDVEGIIYTVDLTNQVLNERIEEILFDRQYSCVALLDIRKSRYSIRSLSLEVGKKLLGSSGSYDRGLKASANFFVEAGDRERYFHSSSMENLRQKLTGQKKYSFTVCSRKREGGRHLLKFSYSYLDEGQNEILAVVEDITYDLDHDTVTGAYSRQGFINFATRLLEQEREASQYAILFFNIKGFKAINELFGVEGGDQVLIQSVKLLQSSELQPLAVGRMEADHFVCLIRKENLDYEALTGLCHRIYERGGKQYRFYGRCGIYMIEDRERSVSGMCDCAKLAKESIKDDYVKPYAMFNSTMRDGFVEKKELISEFHHAMEQSEFHVFYQPVYDVRSGKLASAEALIRWIHPKRGLLSPGKFIPIFEENGFISELDLFVGNHTSRFLQTRIEKGLPVIPIAINLSRMDFYDLKLVNTILSEIRNAGLPLGFPRIEITESAYASMVEHNRELLLAIREKGIKILIDDFGSGYSSFSTLQEFSFDILKLDMGFVQQIGRNRKSEQIIHYLINMAHSLGLQVIAEGVETKEQAEFLIQSDCDFIQGYYYSKPLSEEDFEQLLEKEA